MEKIPLFLILLVIVLHSCKKEKQDIPEAEYSFQVLDAESKEPIPYIKVDVHYFHWKDDGSFWGTIADDSIYTKETNQFGLFDFKAPTNYYVRLSKAGYLTRNVTVDNLTGNQYLVHNGFIRLLFRDRKVYPIHPDFLAVSVWSDLLINQIHDRTAYPDYTDKINAGPLSKGRVFCRMLKCAANVPNSIKISPLILAGETNDSIIQNIIVPRNDTTTIEFDC